jgi:uncharacterized protein
VSSEFPARLAGLLQPAAYLHPVTAVELVQTHTSWVLLTGEFAYKLKRPVRYAFADFTAAERREFFCREELRLNRRFAPELYLEVCAITAPAGGARMGGNGVPVEYAVKMRQFRREQELDQLLAAGRIAPGELEIFGRELAAIHACLPAAMRESPWATPARVGALVLGNLAECVQAASTFRSAATVERLRASLWECLDSVRDCMAARRVAGRVRECHGDLHARNVVRRDATLVAFDCLEFEPEFRWIDVADEVAFLLADLSSRDRPDHAHAFLSGYLAASGDYRACRLLPLYQAHRSLIRAKVTALGATGADEAELGALYDEWQRLMRVADSVLKPRRPQLLLTFGPSGSGKTWLAGELASRLRMIHVRSDVERKRRAGLAPTARTRSGAVRGLYAPEATEATYADLLSDAEDVLSGGYDVLVDASFGRREYRRRFAERTRSLGVHCLIIACEAPLDVLRARITARSRTGSDPSDADLLVLEWQRAHHDALDETERARAIRADTSDTRVLDHVIRNLLRRRAE